MRVLNEHTLNGFNIWEKTDVRGFVAMGDHQCGDEGPKGETPEVSRDIGTVCGFASASVRPFLSYFDLEGVLEKGPDIAQRGAALRVVTCPHLCHYCYANANNAAEMANWNRHKAVPHAETITGRWAMPIAAWPSCRNVMNSVPSALSTDS